MRVQCWSCQELWCLVGLGVSQGPLWFSPAQQPPSQDSQSRYAPTVGGLLFDWIITYIQGYELFLCVNTALFFMYTRTYVTVSSKDIDHFQQTGGSPKCLLIWHPSRINYHSDFCYHKLILKLVLLSLEFHIKEVLLYSIFSLFFSFLLNTPVNVSMLFL